MIVKLLNVDDNFDDICDQLAHEDWGADNDMANYSPAQLSNFVSSPNNLYVVGYEGSQIVCCALCYILRHPDKQRSSMYIDEIDTHPNFRRRGFASQLVSWLRSFAAEIGLHEIWLTTELESNEATNKFYRTIKPSEELKCNLYSYKAE